MNCMSGLGIPVRLIEAKKYYLMYLLGNILHDEKKLSRSVSFIKKICESNLFRILLLLLLTVIFLYVD